MCSLIIRQTPTVRFVRRQKQHEPGVEENQRLAWRQKKKGLIVQDDVTNLIYQMKTKDTSLTLSCLQRFLPPSQKHERTYKGNSKAFIKTCQDLQ